MANEIPVHTGPDQLVSTLTKREYFAAMAMHAHLVNDADVENAEDAAAPAVIAADALLAELNKEKC